MKNWSGNVTFNPALVVYPSEINEIKLAVTAAETVRALGSGHSFNKIADSAGVLIAFNQFPKDIDIDSVGHRVRVAAGVRYGELAVALNNAGLALRNTGSLPHITVVGATSTGTHGSGLTNQNLAAAISAIELITASGDEITITGDELKAARVALGALGIIHHITLEVVPTFDVAQTVYFDLPFENLIHHFEGVMGAGYSVSCFTMWRDLLVEQVWVKSRVGFDTLPGDELFSAKRATVKSHPLVGADTDGATEQFGSVGPWHERLPHFKLDFTPSFGEELQTEYFVDIRDARAALTAVYELRSQIAPLLLVSELRTIASDDNWLSEAQGRNSLAIHFTWKPDVPAVMTFLPALEATLTPFKTRPHWGKLFTDNSFDFEELYPDFTQWFTYRNSLDPMRKFINPQLIAWGI
ncbi:MAG TPA: FAD-binding protein [Candidatus Nanopelagicaceae bacterium]